MKTRRTNKEIIIQIGIITLSVCMLLGCILYIAFNVCCMKIYANNEPEGIAVFCENDDELLLSWLAGCENDDELLLSLLGGVKRTQHDFCPVCGEKTEDVGVIVSENCLKCNAKISENDKFCSSCGSAVEKIYLKEWLKKKEVSNFEEYVKNYEDEIDNRTSKCVLLAFACILPFCLIINSGKIAEIICRKSKKKNNTN